METMEIKKDETVKIKLDDLEGRDQPALFIIKHKHFIKNSTFNTFKGTR